MPVALLFAAIAGYADAIGYLRFKAFAGMMTGNTVLLGIAALRHGDLPAYAYAGIILAFFVSSCVGFAILRLERTSLPVIVFEAAMLALADAIGSGWAILPLVIAMGVQNPLAHRLGVSINTTFITGDLVRFSDLTVARLWPGGGAHVTGSAVSGLAWISYLAGVIAGTLGFGVLGWPLLVPLAGLAYIFGRVARG